jgi:predicted RNase H-like nuclease (RuvC/YqgF family)
MMNVADQGTEEAARCRTVVAAVEAMTEEIVRLKDRLAEKSDRIAHLEAEIAQLLQHRALSGRTEKKLGRSQTG